MKLTSGAVLGLVLTLLSICHANNFADSREHGHVPTHKDSFHKPEVSHYSLTSAPAATTSQYSSGKHPETFRDLRISPSRIDHRLGKEVEILNSERGNLYPSVESYLQRLSMTNVQFVATSGEWWRNITKFVANIDFKFGKDKSATSIAKNRNRRVDFKAVLDNVVVNETFVDVQPSRETYMDGGRGLRNLVGEVADSMTPRRDGCTDCGRFRRKRDEGSSDKTTRDYTITNTREAVDSAINETMSSQEGVKTTPWTFLDATQSSEETKEVNNFTSLPTTAYTSELYNNVSMITYSLEEVTTAKSTEVDYASTDENSASQKSDEDDGKAQDSCSDTSDFGLYGITALSVSVGIVVLLAYVLGMVLVMRRFLERRKLRALHCPYHRGGGSDWLDLGRGSLAFEAEPEGPITNSYLNLPGLDSSSTSGSDEIENATKGDDPHNVSTFLLRRESQQKAEERQSKDKGEMQHGRVDITTTMNITEL